MAGLIKAADIRKMLEDLLNNDPEIEGVSLITSDGLVVASMFRQGEFNEDELGAMSAALTGIAERVVEDFNRGQLEQTIVRGPNGYTVAHGIGEDWVLLLITSPRAKLGMIQFNLKAISETIRKMNI